MFASLHTSALTIRRVQSAGSLHRIANHLRTAIAVRRQRDALARLDARALRDIGIDPAMVAAEVARPLWDVPSRLRA